MIRRHPHVFADKNINTAIEVEKNWEKIKKKESKKHTMDAIPLNLPALMQAELIQKRASRIGFDWDSTDGPLEKLSEELEEIKEIFKKKELNKTKLTEELGDVLFTLVNIARKWELKPEDALRVSSRKFVKRFKKMEKISEKEGRSLSDMNLNELDKLWDNAKK